MGGKSSKQEQQAALEDFEKNLSAEFLQPRVLTRGPLPPSLVVPVAPPAPRLSVTTGKKRKMVPGGVQVFPQEVIVGGQRSLTIPVAPPAPRLSATTGKKRKPQVQVVELSGAPVGMSAQEVIQLGSADVTPAPPDPNAYPNLYYSRIGPLRRPPPIPGPKRAPPPIPQKPAYLPQMVAPAVPAKPVRASAVEVPSISSKVGSVRQKSLSIPAPPPPPFAPAPGLLSQMGQRPVTQNVPVVGGGGPPGLFTQIRQGVPLRHVSMSKAQQKKEASLRSDLAKQIAALRPMVKESIGSRQSIDW